MFETILSWFDRRQALRELRAPAQQDAYVAHFSRQIDLATAELKAGARDKALQICRDLRTTLPDLVLKSGKALNLLVDLGCHDEAEALITEGRRRFPSYQSLYAGVSARVAYRRGDTEEAIRRCASIRHKFPRVADGYGIAASCLSDLGRDDEADALLKRGASKLPDNIELNLHYAQHAEHRHAWEDALRRWEVVQRRFKEHVIGWLGAARCLKEMGRIDDAAKILKHACAQEKNPLPFIELANLATSRGDFEDAADQWEVILVRFPTFEHAYRLGARAMRQAGRELRADELLRVVARRSPSNLSALLEYARSAHRRADWAAAAERWAVIREKFAECDEAVKCLSEALSALEQQGRSSDD